MNNWEKLCKNLSPLLSQQVNESLFHQLFAAFLETIFHWGDADIQQWVSVQFGRETKYSDIVLKGDNFGIVIEMKAPSVPLGEKETGQLISYMNQLKCKYGLLVGYKIQVFYDDDTKIKMITEINYNSNNEDGVKLGEILDGRVCSNEELKKYMLDRIERKPLPISGGTGSPEDIQKNWTERMKIGKLKEVADIYNDRYKMFQAGEVTKGTYLYSSIRIPKWPRYLHYEFLLRDEGYIGIELHFENRVERERIREIFNNYRGKKIENHPITIDVNRIGIRAPLEEDSNRIALLMNTFIEETRGKITG
jgi:hypothetical protein